MSLIVSSNKLKFRENTSSAWQGLLLQGKAEIHPLILQNDVDYFADPDDLPASAAVGTLAFVEASNTILNLVYPVGSIYMSVNNTSPTTLFGGTWEQIKDRFLLSAGDTYTAGDTGGEAAHTLTVNELAVHSHPFKPSSGLQDTSILQVSGSAYPDLPAIFKGAGWTSEGYVEVGSSGGDQAHNNMPPYLVVYIWKRTA